MASGTYDGSVQVSSQFSSLLTVPVSLTVASNTLSLSQSQLIFSCQSGASVAPPPQIVNVSSLGSGLNYSAAVTSGVPWLTINNGVGATPGSVQVSVNPGSLATGTYNGSIQFTAPYSPAVSLPVTLTVVGTTTLSAAPSNLSFTSPGSQTLTLSTNGPSVPFTVASSTSSGGNWLSVSTTSGTAPTTVTVSAEVRQACVGTYSGQISLTAPGIQGLSVPVSLTVGGATSITAAPQSLTFTMSQGSTAQSAQPLQLSSTGQNQAFSLLLSTGSWLAVSPPGGSTPAQLTVALVNASSLAAGTYSSTITVSSGSATTLQIPVTLIVQPPPGNVFSVSAPTLSYTFSPTNQAGQSPSSRVLVVQSQSLIRLPYKQRLKTNSPWVQVSPATATVAPYDTASMSVQILPSHLPSPPSGSEVLIISSNGQTSNLQINVAAQDISQVQPVLSATGVTFYALSGSSSVTSDEKAFTFYNGGSVAFDWSIIVDEPTLNSPTPAADTSALQPGIAQTIKLTTSSYAGEPSQPTGVNIAVKATSGNFTVVNYITGYIDVLSGNEYVNVPPQIDNSGLILGPLNFTQPSLTITNPSSNDQPFSVVSNAGSSAGIPSWLKVTPSGSSIPGKNNSKGNTAAITFQTQNQPPNSVTTVPLSIQLPGYYAGQVFGMPISVTYVPPASTSSGGASSSSVPAYQSAVTTCVPTDLTAVFGSPAPLFQSPAGLPVNIVATIADNCGAALPSSGAATVSFSSSDPAIALSPFPDGTWRATWQPSAPSAGLVLLQITAASSNVSLTAKASISGTITASSLVPILAAVVDSAGGKVTSGTNAAEKIVRTWAESRQSSRSGTRRPTRDNPRGGSSLAWRSTHSPILCRARTDQCCRSIQRASRRAEQPNWVVQKQSGFLLPCL